MDKILNKLKSFSKEELLEVCHELNRYEWHEKLGEQPDEYTTMSFALENEIKNVTDKNFEIIKPLMDYIFTQVTEEEFKEWHRGDNKI